MLKKCHKFNFYSRRCLLWTRPFYLCSRNAISLISIADAACSEHAPFTYVQEMPRVAFLNVTQPTLNMPLLLMLSKGQESHFQRRRRLLWTYQFPRSGRMVHAELQQQEWTCCLFSEQECDHIPISAYALCCVLMSDYTKSVFLLIPKKETGQMKVCGGLKRITYLCMLSVCYVPKGNEPRGEIRLKKHIPRRSFRKPCRCVSDIPKLIQPGYYVEHNTSILYVIILLQALTYFSFLRKGNGLMWLLCCLCVLLSTFEPNVDFHKIWHARHITTEVITLRAQWSIYIKM
jgi:hypothetical protein